MAENGQESSALQPGPGLLLIVGLGNPGPKYAETRHNAGFWFLDRLIDGSGQPLRVQQKLHAETARVSLRGRDCVLARPLTFMNHSGRSVQAIAAYYRIPADRILVAYDELDLPPGVARLKFDGGHGGHNGMRDICQQLGTQAFYRLRIGIGHPGFKDAVTPWVLSRPGRDHEILIRDSIERSLDALPEFIAGHFHEAMKRLHTGDQDGH